MGADSKSESIVCSKAPQITTNSFETPDGKEIVDVKNAALESDSTLNAEAITEVIEECKNISHEAELEKFKEVGAKTPILPSEIGTDFNFKREIVWFNLIGFALLHLMGLIGFLQMIFQQCDWRTTVYSEY